MRIISRLRKLYFPLNTIKEMYRAVQTARSAAENGAGHGVRKECFELYPKNYDPSAFVSNPGQRFKTEYIGEPDEDGIIQLVAVGKTDLVELHQRDADCNDVNILYERFCNGDVTAFSQRQGTYMDALGLPRDLRGMYDLVEDFRKSYDNLKPEMKEKYTFEEFISKAGSEKWLADFAASTNSEAVPPAEPASPAAE